MRSAWRRCAPSPSRRSRRDADLRARRDAENAAAGARPRARARRRRRRKRRRRERRRRGADDDRWRPSVSRATSSNDSRATCAAGRDGTSRDARPGDETLRFPFRRRPARERRGGSTLSPVGDSRAFGSRGECTVRRRTRVGYLATTRVSSPSCANTPLRWACVGPGVARRGARKKGAANGDEDGNASTEAKVATRPRTAEEIERRRAARAARDRRTGVCAAPARGFHASIRGGRRRRGLSTARARVTGSNPGSGASPRARARAFADAR